MSDWREWAIFIAYVLSGVLALILCRFIPSLSPWENWIASAFAAGSGFVYFFFVKPSIDAKNEKRKAELDEYIRQHNQRH